MIDRIRGWVAAREGETLVMFPPGADTVGIKHVERIRPVRAPLEIVRGLPLPDGAELASIGEPRELVTDEGEQAVLVETRAVFAGAQVHRAIGMVFVDDFYSLTIGHARAPAQELTPLVEQLVRNERHLMVVRRRPFRFAAPDGWTRRQLDRFVTAFDNGDRRITVLPALPREAINVHAALEASVEAPIQSATARTPIRAHGELRGETWSVDTGTRVHDLAYLECDRFLYAVLQARSRQGSTVELDTLIASVEPVLPITRPSGDVLFHWFT